MNGRKFGLFFCFILCSRVLFADDGIPEKAPDKGYVPPFQVFDNIYYVGDKWVSSYLITTDAGLILVDTLEYPYSKWLPDNIKQLGLEPADIKWLIITHGHSDHASGAGWLQAQTGATLLMTTESRQLMNRFFAANIDIVAPDKKTLNIVVDSEKLTLGSTELIVHTTPGHTDGAISLELQARKGDKSYKALIFGGVGTNYHTLALAEKYLKSVAKLQNLHKQEAFYVNLANHPHRARLFEKIALRTASQDPLVDAAAFSRFLTQLQRGGELRRQELTYKQQQSK